MCEAFVTETARSLSKATPTFDGTRAENLALQNVQARSRMVFAYLMAQLGPWGKGKDGFVSSLFFIIIKSIKGSDYLIIS